MPSPVDVSGLPTWAQVLGSGVAAVGAAALAKWASVLGKEKVAPAPPVGGAPPPDEASRLAVMDYQRKVLEKLDVLGAGVTGVHAAVDDVEAAVVRNTEAVNRSGAATDRVEGAVRDLARDITRSKP